MLVHLCTVRADDTVNYETVIEKISAALPSNWRVAKIKADVLPEGHYWGLKYEGPRGCEVVLQGPSDVHFRWLDSDGTWHREPLAKEALFLYLMPDTYSESWKRFFVMKSPPKAKLLLSTPKLKVYGYPAAWVVSPSRIDEIVRSQSTKEVGWPDSPRYSGVLSWVTWKKDIVAILRGIDYLHEE
jgi:hypothetical protein